MKWINAQGVVGAYADTFSWTEEAGGVFRQSVHVIKGGQVELVSSGDDECGHCSLTFYELREVYEKACEVRDLTELAEGDEA